MALSMRLPSTVTISCGVSTKSSASAGSWVSSVTVNADAAFVGLGGLAEQQCDQRGLADGVGQPVHELLRQREFLGRELDRLVGAAHLDHGDDGVQLVRRLVGLRAQRVGQHLQRAEFAQRALQFGAVANGDHLRVRGARPRRG